MARTSARGWQLASTAIREQAAAWSEHGVAAVNDDAFAALAITPDDVDAREGPEGCVAGKALVGEPLAVC